MYIPTDNLPPDDALLRRREVAEILTAAGYPITLSHLNTMVSRGGGPAYLKFGGITLYPWGSTLEWAKSRTRLVPATPATATRRNAA